MKGMKSSADHSFAKERLDLRASKFVEKQAYVFSDTTNGFISSKEATLGKIADSELAFTSEKERQDYLSLDMGSMEFMKVLSAKRMLRNLDQRHKSIFKGQPSNFEVDIAEKDVFFNSNLLYMIAATDGNEDTLEHSQLVAGYTLLLTKALGIKDRDFLVNIERGALLHDIGKIGIPESILRKAGPLTMREREIVNEHPLLGYEMIEGFDFLRGTAQVVLFHHEHYDGSGYPYGLIGEEIPLEARIFALADSLDALTSYRPYKEEKSFEEALRAIEKGRGSQFDPLLLDGFLSIPKEEWQQVRAETPVSLSLPTIH